MKTDHLCNNPTLPVDRCINIPWRIHRVALGNRASTDCLFLTTTSPERGDQLRRSFNTLTIEISSFEGMFLPHVLSANLTDLPAPVNKWTRRTNLAQSTTTAAGQRSIWYLHSSAGAADSSSIDKIFVADSANEPDCRCHQDIHDLRALHRATMSDGQSSRLFCHSILSGISNTSHITSTLECWGVQQR